MDEFRELAHSDPGLGMDIIGDISVRPGSLGGIEDFPAVVERFKIQEVVVLPSYVERELMFPFFCPHGGRVLEVGIISPAARFLGKGVRVRKIGDNYMFSIERGAQFLFLSLFRFL